jgi:hypothetical protein
MRAAALGQLLGLWATITLLAVLFGWPVLPWSAAGLLWGLASSGLFLLTPVVARHLDAPDSAGREPSTRSMTLVWGAFILAPVLTAFAVLAHYGELSAAAIVAAPLVIPPAAFIMASAGSLVGHFVADSKGALHSAAQWGVATLAFAVGIGPLMLELVSVAEYVTLWLPTLTVTGVLGGLLFWWQDIPWR